jgi:cytochrome c peroxidase
MSSVRRLRGLGALLAFAAALGCGQAETTPGKATARPAASSRETVNREPLAPLPAVGALDPKRVALGRRLFHDARLSADGKVACATCHDLEKGGDSGQKFATGSGGKLGLVNVPTVYNAALNFAQFWDGRAATLEEQVGGPLTNPVEMGNTWPKVLEKLRADASYGADFGAAFPDGITEANVRTAIADFERALITTGSAFDRFLGGDKEALGPLEKTGYETFKSVGCIACHQGANVGGNMYQRFGVLGDYFKDRGNVTEADYGRYNVTKSESDRFVFRVPSLRNVEHTAPYFHDGSAETLEQAVQVMARYQLGRKLGPEQVTAIIAFLKSLSGQLAKSGPR